MKYVYLIIGCFFILIILYIGAKYIVPSGNYSYAEIYEFNIKETQLIKIVEDFKQKNPQYIVPIEKLKDGKKDSSDYYYGVYSYYSSENNIIYFFIGSSDKGKAQIGLVSINDGLTLGHWRDVNKDFSHSENKEVKKVFEQRILNNLGLTYKDKGNGMKIGFIQL